MRCLFISDAHYPLSKRIEHFLLDTYHKFDAIFILGDLFEFYYGYTNYIYPHHASLINTLSFIGQHTDLVLFEGNHEYKLENIKQFIKADVVKESLDIKLDNNRIYLAHGDTIDKGDIGYRIFRMALKNRFTLGAISLLPSNFLLEMSRMASGFSKSKLKKKAYRRTTEELERFAYVKLNSGFDVVILAHTHSPGMKKLNNGLYINTGDFLEHFTYVTYESSKGFQLREV